MAKTSEEAFDDRLTVALALLLAEADGATMQEQDVILRRLGSRLTQMPDPVVSALVVRTHDDLRREGLEASVRRLAKQIHTREARLAALAECIAVVLVDRKVSDAEMGCIVTMADAMGLGEADVAWALAQR